MNSQDHENLEQNIRSLLYFSNPNTYKIENNENNNDPTLNGFVDFFFIEQMSYINSLLDKTSILPIDQQQLLKQQFNEIVAAIKYNGGVVSLEQENILRELKLKIDSKQSSIPEKTEDDLLCEFKQEYKRQYSTTTGFFRSRGEVLNNTELCHILIYAKENPRSRSFQVCQSLKWLSINPQGEISTHDEAPHCIQELAKGDSPSVPDAEV